MVSFPSLFDAPSVYVLVFIQKKMFAFSINVSVQLLHWLHFLHRSSVFSSWGSSLLCKAYQLWGESRSWHSMFSSVNRSKCRGCVSVWIEVVITLLKIDYMSAQQTIQLAPPGVFIMESGYILFLCFDVCSAPKMWAKGSVSHPCGFTQLTTPNH